MINSQPNSSVRPAEVYIIAAESFVGSHVQEILLRSGWSTKVFALEEAELLIREFGAAHRRPSQLIMGGMEGFWVAGLSD